MRLLLSTGPAALEPAKAASGALPPLQHTLAHLGPRSVAKTVDGEWVPPTLSSQHTPEPHTVLATFSGEQTSTQPSKPCPILSSPAAFPLPTVSLGLAKGDRKARRWVGGLRAQACAKSSKRQQRAIPSLSSADGSICPHIPASSLEAWPARGPTRG